MWGRSWPRPQRIDLRRLRTRLRCLRTGGRRGLVFVLTGVLRVEEDEPVTDPRDLVRGGLTVSLAAALGGGLVFGLTVGGGRAAVRYFAFLLCARGRLPWRLGRFLDACYRLGILRVVWAAWQFRHRELQDRLATRPVPPSRPPTLSSAVMLVRAGQAPAGGLP